MGVVGIILLVVFVIICVLLIGLILLQNEEGNGMGGLFGGANSQAFGARSGNILSKATCVLVTLFFVVCFVLAILNKAPARNSIDEAAKNAASNAPANVEATQAETPAETEASAN